MYKLFFAVVLLGILGGTAVYFKAEAERERVVLAMYRGNNQVLLQRLKKVYADKMELDRKNAELEQAAAADKTGFDWGFDISNSAVIKRLRAD